MTFFLLAAALAATALIAPPPAVAKTRQAGPEIQLPLADFGFPGISPAFLSSGGSMLTVHFADSDHLLLTYSLRGLVPRVAGDPPEHEDRIVAAKLVDLSSRKIVAQTEWHLHDHGRYLWNLGNGRFLLRIQDTLSTFAPVANLATKEPFLRTSFPRRAGTVEAVVVSADNQLVTVETSLGQPKKEAAAPRQPAFDASRPHFTSNATEPPPPPPSSPPPPVQPRPAGPAFAYDLYRISGSGAMGGDPLLVKGVGAFGANSMVALPLDSDGYLRTLDQSHGRWAVSFHAFSGKDLPLASIATTCAPDLQRVSPGQLVAFNCHGAIGGIVLAAYDFAKHEMWEEPLAGSPLPSTFSLAPSSGRFAMSRVTAMNSDAAPSTLTQDTGTSQDVRVYQTQTGDLLLKIDSSPVYRSAENFDLSPNGIRLAVVRKNAVEIYRLPELTKQDIDDLAEIEKLAPPPGAGPINFAGLVDTAANSQTAATTVSGGAPPTPANVSGDSQAVHRPPPSLLNPGEKPEFPSKNGPTN